MCLRWLVVISFAACGRFGFDSSGDAKSSDSVTPACTHTFCDSFDHEGPVDTGWDSATVTGGATLAIDDTTSVSAPGSLRVTFDNTSTGVAFLQRSFPIVQTRLRYAVDLDLETTDTTAEIDLADMSWVAPPAPCTSFGFYLVRSRNPVPAQLVLQETYNGCGGNLDTVLPYSAGFHHVEVEVDIGAAAHVRVMFDGILALDHPVMVDVPASPLKLVFGAPFIQAASAAWVIHYDNLAVDVL